MASKFVFYRHDSHRTPLSCLYDIPKHPDDVLEPGDKVFRVLQGYRGAELATVDRLKPAVMSTSMNSPLEQRSTSIGIATRNCKIETNIVTS